jgi:steroid delta-isomerase-like uncharacterized protein
MSSSLSPREVAAQWFQRVWNEQDASAIFELMAPDAVGHLEDGQIAKGPEGFREFQSTLLTLFPNISVKILDIIEEGEKVVTRWEASGTHQGSALGLPATGLGHQFQGMTWMIVREGKVVEGGDSWNQGGLMRRMGAV